MRTKLLLLALVAGCGNSPLPEQTGPCRDVVLTRAWVWEDLQCPHLAHTIEAVGNNSHNTFICRCPQTPERAQ